MVKLYKVNGKECDYLGDEVGGGVKGWGQRGRVTLQTVSGDEIGGGDGGERIPEQGS